MKGIFRHLHKDRQAGASLALVALAIQLVLMLAGVALPSFGKAYAADGSFVICSMNGPIDPADGNAPHTYQHCDCLLMASAVLATPPAVPPARLALAGRLAADVSRSSPRRLSVALPPARAPPVTLA